jgi:hypothetical protein
MSSTSPGTLRPPAVAAGVPWRVSTACAQATSRAAARAARNRASPSASAPSSTRHAVRARPPRQTAPGWAAQHRQIGDRLTAVREHHRHIGRDPARLVTGAPATQRRPDPAMRHWSPTDPLPDRAPPSTP